jgi:hypothetical protein
MLIAMFVPWTIVIHIAGTIGWRGITLELREVNVSTYWRPSFHSRSNHAIFAPKLRHNLCWSFLACL